LFFLFFLFFLKGPKKYLGVHTRNRGKCALKKSGSRVFSKRKRRIHKKGSSARKTKKKKKKVFRKTKMEVETNASSATVVSAQPVEELDEVIKKATERTETMRKELALLSGELKVLKRLAARAVRAPRRRRVPEANDATDRKPSGFARPSPLSDQLCAVLGVEKGTEMPRTTVTRMICKIIKDNGINDAVNKRQIDLSKPQAQALKALLVPEPGATITYFNLQKYLKKHIGAATDPVSATTTATPAAPTTAPTPAPTTAPTTQKGAGAGAGGEQAAEGTKPKRQRQAA
jgi:chromatin remodeling complex protein RSC6